MDKPWPVHIVFASADRKTAQSLRRHLAVLVQQRRITVFDQDTVLPGAPLQEALAAQLDAARMVILLVSVDLLNDPFWEKDLQPLLERRRRGAVVVVPLLVRRVFLSGSPLETLAFLPRSGRSLDEWPSPDEALSEIVGHLQDLLPAPTVPKENPDLEPLLPCPVRTLSQGQIFQLCRTLSRVLPDRASIERHTKLLRLGALPADEPADVLWKEVLRRLKNADGDVAPLIAVGQRLAPDDPLWPQLTAVQRS